ncbi:MAG: hypothetical protein Ta2F_02500 [Termitinemataceae bacterium]|nr:MAG: hypothetical protein Ta2F_02500 [Termitinemataceae bacterium]
MKKFPAILIIVFITVSIPAFAQSKKADSKAASNKNGGMFSGGLGVTGISTHGKDTIKYVNPQSEYDPLGGYVENTETKTESYKHYSKNSIGGFLFFDAKYGEFDISFSGVNGLGTNIYYARQNWTGLELGLALLGKFPFKLGKSGLTLAPVAGLQFDMVLTAKDDDGNRIGKGEVRTDTSGEKINTGIVYRDQNNGYKPYGGKVIDLSSITAKFGLDVRYPLAKRLFIDAQYLWGINFYSKYNKTWREYKKDTSKDEIRDIKNFTNSSTFKLAIGMNF